MLYAREPYLEITLHPARAATEFVRILTQHHFASTAAQTGGTMTHAELSLATARQKVKGCATGHH